MYSIYDYIYNGTVFANNAICRRHKVLISPMIYSTTNCQSRCKHCSIWKRLTENLRLDDVIKTMNSKCITKCTTIGLEGSEFILHPETDEILGWFDAHHPNYTLLSNCLAVNKVISAVENYYPKHLYISLGGTRETYLYMCDRDGYDKVIEVIEACRDIVPISSMFYLSPWNSFEDTKHIINCAKKYSIDVRIGIYNTMSFFDTTKDLMGANNDNFTRQTLSSIYRTDENFDFVALCDGWKNNRLKLRRHSIFSELVIHSNGDVPLCQNLDVALGNTHENMLYEIFNSKETCKIQRQYPKTCNQCWINYHRKYDIILSRNPEKMSPKRLIELFYEKYQWSSNTQITYKKHFKQITA